MITAHVLGLPVLTTTEVCKRLGFIVSVDYLKSCGITPAQTEQRRAGTYWLESDMPRIKQAIAAKLMTREGLAA